jgi:hypothetical protein
MMKKYAVILMTLGALQALSASAQPGATAAQSANPSMPNLAGKTPEEVAAAPVQTRRSVGHPVQHPELVPAQAVAASPAPGNTTTATKP